MIVRTATSSDADATVLLLNALLATTTVEWTDDPHTSASIVTWMAEHETVLVAEDESEIVGVAAFGWFRDAVKRPGYRFTVEHTIHVREDRWGTGVGPDLMAALVDRAQKSGKHTMVAAIDGANLRSISDWASWRWAACPKSVPSSVDGWTSSCSSSVWMSDDSPATVIRVGTATQC